MKLGLVGYGFGGRIFHTPFCSVASSFEFGGGNWANAILNSTIQHTDLSVDWRTL